MNVRTEDSIPNRKERREVAFVLRRVMQAVELRPGNPAADRTEPDSGVHVNPVAPQREHRPEPDDRDRLEIENNRHRQIDDECAKELFAEMVPMDGRHVQPLLLMMEPMLHPQPFEPMLRAMPPIEKK